MEQYISPELNQLNNLTELRCSWISSGFCVNKILCFKLQPRESASIDSDVTSACVHSITQCYQPSNLELTVLTGLISTVFNGRLDTYESGTPVVAY